MIAQAIRVATPVYNPVSDSYETHVTWKVLVTTDNYEKDIETYQVDSRYSADKLCTQLNRAFHPEWFLY